MKAIHLSIISILLFFNFSAISQDCEKDISTNPVAPYNNHPFPSSRYNPWINSDFNIGGLVNGNVPPMELNNQITWQISDFVFGTAFEMMNPYTSAGTPGTRYSYLHPTGIDFEYLDYKWEDGWEVLHVGLGFYPNGEEIQIPSAQRAYSLGVSQPSNPRVPYVILYNRYRGTLRLFMNLFTSFSGYSDIRMWLEFDDDSPSGLSGILRHLEPFDRALDQTTNVKRHESYNPNSGGNNRWFSADFQLGYDPCICGINQKWKITLQGIESFSVNLYGRGLTVELPLSDGQGNPTYDMDWLSSTGLQDGLSGGNQIFTSLQGLVDDYKEALDRYSVDSENYQDYIERKAVIDAFKGFIVDGTIGLVPASGVFKPWFLTSSESGANNDPGANFANFIKGSAKGLFGFGYDQLSMTVNPKQSAPKAPDMPTASYSEMRFEGTIEGTSQAETIGPFFIPGTYDESSSLTNLDPFNYPAYNSPTGLIALLNSPQPIVTFETEIDSIRLLAPSPDWYCLGKFKYDAEYNMKMRFTESMQFTLNPNLDFNMDLTRTYVCLEMILDNGLPRTLTGTHSKTISETTNLSLDMIFTDSGRQYIYRSDWVPLEELNQYVFDLSHKEIHEVWQYGISNQYSCGIDPDPNNNPNYTAENLEFHLANVKIKVLHDFYFHQVGSSGTRINTTQVHTYNLFDRTNGIDDLNNEGPWSSNVTGYFDLYIPGTITLGNETITTNHPLVHHVDGDEIYINAQEVIINGPLQVQQGYILIIQALEQIHIQPGPESEYNPKVHLRIKKDFYNTTVFEYADQTTVTNFCSQNGQYQANSASRPLMERILKEQAELAALEKSKPVAEINTIRIHPNPTSGLLQITSSNAPINQIEVYDLAGRRLYHQSFGNGAGRQVQADLSALSNGVYVVKTTSGGVVSTEKLVVGR